MNIGNKLEYTVNETLFAAYRFVMAQPFSLVDVWVFFLFCVLET